MGAGDVRPKMARPAAQHRATTVLIACRNPKSRERSHGFSNERSRGCPGPCITRTLIRKSCLRQQHSTLGRARHTAARISKSDSSPLPANRHPAQTKCCRLHTSAASQGQCAPHAAPYFYTKRFCISAWGSSASACPRLCLLRNSKKTRPASLHIVDSLATAGSAIVIVLSFPASRIPGAAAGARRRGTVDVMPDNNKGPLFDSAAPIPRAHIDKKSSPPPARNCSDRSQRESSVRPRPKASPRRSPDD